MKMAFRFSGRSLKNMIGVHNDLVAVTHRALAISTVDFTVIEGMRTIERQRQLVAKGASKTMNSRHLTGHAVDLAPFIDGAIRWDWPPFHEIADAMKRSALDLDIPIEWGGDWKSFKDGPHFQLPWSAYPA
jgi:peptidoglycan L-alanyl-D-glutamate endopeptidase CwlK